MPYPHEHSLRLYEPEHFYLFRRQNNKFGKGVHAIWGRTREGKLLLQALRFDNKRFSVLDVEKWIDGHPDIVRNYIHLEPAAKANPKRVRGFDIDGITDEESTIPTVESELDFGDYDTLSSGSSIRYSKNPVGHKAISFLRTGDVIHYQNGTSLMVIKHNLRSGLMLVTDTKTRQEYSTTYKEIRSTRHLIGSIEKG